MKKIIWYISLMIILILACFWFKYYVSHSWYCLLDEWIIDDWSYDKWELYLWSLKRISDENLQYLVNHIRSELILWLEELADSQAEIISKFNGDTIKLNNLKILTDEQAKILSQYTWFNLYLNWLEELTDVQTDNLVGNHSLYLEWLTNPTNEQLEIMVKNTWRQDLWLWLEEINEEQARILSQRKASLNLDKISEISDDVLEILLSWSIQRISLGWLTSLTDKQAELLSNYKGWLYLDGVKELTDKQAELLSNHKSQLSLNWLRKISNEGLEYLMKSNHIPRYVDYTADQLRMIYKNNDSNVPTQWLTSLDDEKIAIIRYRWHVNSSYDSLKDITDEQLLEVTKDSIWYHVNLDFLTWFTYSKAEILKHQLNISLNGLKAISPELLGIISNSEWNILLNGLETISLDQIEVLKDTLRYSFYFDGVKRLTAEQAKSLWELNITTLSLNWIEELSDSQLKDLMWVLTWKRKLSPLSWIRYYWEWKNMYTMKRFYKEDTNLINELLQRIFRVK